MLKYAIIGIVAVCVLVFVIPKKKAEIASPPAPAVGAPKAPEAQRPSPAENQEKLVYKEPETGLVWARNGNIAGRVMNWHEAMSWANNLSYAGYSDWRLPTKDELESLAKVDENRPSEWLNAYGFNNVQAYGYWSSSTYAGSTTFAWVVGMGNGDVYGGYKGNYRYVWPVRGGQ